MFDRAYCNCNLYFIFLKTRYEVAPRSDSEESGSEFEEEVSDSLFNELSQVEDLRSAFLSCKSLNHENVIKCNLEHLSFRPTLYVHTHTKHIRIQQGAVNECTSVML